MYGPSGRDRVRRPSHFSGFSVYRRGGIIPRMRYLAIVALALTVVAGAGARGTSLRSGLYGTVTRGPIAPVCAAEQPCSEPAVGAVLIFSRGARDVARVTVGPTGSYRLGLSAGRYSVRAFHQRRLNPATARVYVGRMLRLDFLIDTGIR